MVFFPTSPLSLAALFFVVLLVLYLVGVKSSTIRSVGIQPGPFNLRRRAARLDWAEKGYLRVQDAYNRVEILSHFCTMHG